MLKCGQLPMTSRTLKMSCFNIVTQQQTPVSYSQQNEWLISATNSLTVASTTNNSVGWNTRYERERYNHDVPIS